MVVFYLKIMHKTCLVYNTEFSIFDKYACALHNIPPPLFFWLHFPEHYNCIVHMNYLIPFQPGYRQHQYCYRDNTVYYVHYIELQRIKVYDEKKSVCFLTKYSEEILFVTVSLNHKGHLPRHLLKITSSRQVHPQTHVMSIYMYKQVNNMHTPRGGCVCALEEVLPMTNWHHLTKYISVFHINYIFISGTIFFLN